MLGCLLCSHSLADESLSEHPQWLSLLHFDKGGRFASPRSAILDPSFFLAENGARDPAAELQASLLAFRQPDASEHEHALCRFPARALWLSRMLNETWAAQPQCPQWQQWQQENQQAEVGLIFASGYLGNPASFFGHLMLHLGESSQAPSGQAADILLDESLNFGASVPDEDGLLVYMLKGLFGGYHAEFSTAPFYRNTVIYSESEMRELWHYSIRLDPQQRRLLLAHLWEILGVEYEYLFLTQNCASRIARTLELVIDADLTAGAYLWVAPETVINAINQAQDVHGNSLVAGVNHRPSRRLITEQRFSQLNREQQEAASAAWAQLDHIDLDHPHYQQLSQADQAEVVDVWLSHLNYLRKTEQDFNAQEVERQLLAHRLRLPPGQRSANLNAPSAIHTARPTARIAAGLAYHRTAGTSLRLAFRPLQYDLLDSDNSRQPDASLELASLELEHGAQTTRLRRLDAFKISNLHSERVPLPGSQGMAWSAAAGWAGGRLACADCRPGAHLTALSGYSQRREASVGFALAGARLSDHRFMPEYLAGVIKAGWMSDWGDNSRSLITLEHHNGIAGRASRRSLLALDWRQELGPKHDLRLAAQLEMETGASEVSINLGRYF